MTLGEYLDALLSLPAMLQATLPSVGRSTVAPDGRRVAWNLVPGWPGGACVRHADLDDAGKSFGSGMPDGL